MFTIPYGASEINKMYLFYKETRITLHERRNTFDLHKRFEQGWTNKTFFNTNKTTHLLLTTLINDGHFGLGCLSSNGADEVLKSVLCDNKK